MSDGPGDFRAGHATPPHLHEALGAYLPRSGCRSTRQNLCVWPAVERRTQKHRIDCLSFWPISLPLQSFIGWDAWDDAPLREELRSQVKTHLGQSDGVLGFDPSGFPKSGRESVGVARQWCGRLGKVDNCQVAMYLGDVSRKGHTLVDTRRYLPKEWTKDKARLDKAGVPKAFRAFRTRHQLALEMLEHHSASLPHRWIAGDDEMGRPYWFRRRLEALGEQYLLAVPSNTSMRDLEGELPAYSGRGRRPQRPWQHVEAWSQSLDDTAWHRIDVRDGSKGPLVVEAVK